MPALQPQPKDIRTLSFPELEAWVAATGEKKFRAKQIWEWLWQKRARSFQEMTNLSKALRQRLAEEFRFNILSVAHQQRSADGTIKYGFRLADGEIIEGVLIPTSDRLTACISSQSGCSLACKFCATGYMKLKRNLQHYEITEQVQLLDAFGREHFGRGLSNIVYMGMGEPLLNYKHVMASIERITAPDGFGFGARRITVSTAGIAKMIKRLGDDGARFEFALSLHAADDAKRNEIMAINETNSLEVLGEALQYFHQKTGTRITLEYIVFSDFNDSPADARQLAAFSKRVPSKVNIIEYNPIAFADFQNASEQRFNRFVEILEQERVIVNVRRSRGKDVDGGCGQLAVKQETPANA